MSAFTYIDTVKRQLQNVSMWSNLIKEVTAKNCNFPATVSLFSFQIRRDIDDVHQVWFKEFCTKAQQCDITPKKPRTCGRQTQRVNISSNSVEEYFKLGVAVPFLDHILSEFEHRYLIVNGYDNINKG